AEDGIRVDLVTGVQTCALPISVVAPVLAACGGAASPTAAPAKPAEPTKPAAAAPAPTTAAAAPAAAGSAPTTAPAAPAAATTAQIGRASCRERAPIELATVPWQ